MSTPQLEDGYAKLANELLEAFLRAGLTANQWKVAMAIVRKTYGFNKTEDDLSASQIAEMCELARPHVAAALNQLAMRNIIMKRPGRFGSIVGVQKDHRKWVRLDKLASDAACTDSVQGCTENVHVQNPYRGCTESVQSMCTESVHTKDNYPKDNHQKTKSCAPQADHDQVHADGATPSKQKSNRLRVGANVALAAKFERFYDGYPKKRGRIAAQKAFAKIDPDDATVDMMLAAVVRLQQSGEWTDPKFIPHPASWLNAGGWFDQVQTAYTADEVEVIEVFNELLGNNMGHVSASVFDSTRAALIRAFLTFNAKPELARRFFGWFAKTSEAPPRAGLDWLIGRKVYHDAIEGKYERKAA
jgi:phage replication O-like protein O